MIGLVIVTIILISIGIVLIKYSNKVSKDPPKKSKAAGKDKAITQAKQAIQIVGGIIILLIIFNLITMAYDGTTNFFSNKMDDRDSKEERCINETYNIKNDFTAKKMYKACMNR